MAFDSLAGKVAVLTATIEEYETSLLRATPEAGVIRRISDEPSW